MFQHFNDVYLVATTADGHGEVIASRSRNVKKALGCDIDRLLSMSKKESRFVCREFNSGFSSCVLASCGEVEKRAVLFGRLPSRGNVLLAVSFDYPIQYILKLIREADLDGITLSDELAGIDVPDDPPTFDGRWFRCLSELTLLCEMPRIDVANYEELEEMLPDLIVRIADMLGVPVCTGNLPHSLLSWEGGIFERLFDVGSVCTAMCFMALTAYRFAPDRVLHLELCSDDTGAKMSFWFGAKGLEKVAVASIERVMSDLCGENKVCMIEDGEFICDLYPDYSDVGLMGVKDGNVDIGELLLRMKLGALDVQYPSENKNE